jgi:RHS repeat-associated protein
LRLHRSSLSVSRNDDVNGNVTEYVSESGAVVASYVYDAFGNLLSATGPMSDAFFHRFSTKYWDAETCLYYYGYRFYAPELGRWINRDPIEEMGVSNL